MSPRTGCLLSAVALLALAAAAAARPVPLAGPAHLQTLQPWAPGRRLSQVVQNPRPYTQGVFNGTIVPVPQGPLSSNEVRLVTCRAVPYPTGPGQLPGDWIPVILDVLISQPACRMQLALTGGLGYRP